MAKKKPKIKSASGTVIPDTVSGITNTIGDALVWLYGPAKIGKTTLASHFPDTLFIFTEDGGKFLPVRAVQFDGSPVCPDWDSLLDIIPAVEKDHSRTLVLDRVETLYVMCMRAVCDANNVAHPNDLPYGKGWSLLRAEWNRVMSQICNLGKGVVFISLAAERTYNNGLEEVTKIGPDIPRQGYDIINALSDFIMYYGHKRVTYKDSKGKKKRKMQRVLYTQPTDDIAAGDRTGLMPSHIEMPAGKDAYAALNDTFEDIHTKLVQIAKGQ